MVAVHNSKPVAMVEVACKLSQSFFDSECVRSADL